MGDVFCSVSISRFSQRQREEHSECSGMSEITPDEPVRELDILMSSACFTFLERLRPGRRHAFARRRETGKQKGL